MIAMALGNQHVLSIPVLQLMRIRWMYVIMLRRQHQSLLAPKLIGKGTFNVIYILSQQPGSLTMYRVPMPLVGEPRVRTVQVAEAPIMMEGNHTNHDTPLTSSVAVSPM